MATAWWPARTLAFDFETSGTNVHTDRIVTACAAIMERGEPVFKRSWLVAVDVDIPQEAVDVHGITTAHAREHGVPAAEAIPEIANAIRYAVHSRMPVVAFNASFDLSLLNAECVRHGLGTLAEFCDHDIAPVLDGHVLDKATDKYRPGERKLAAVCKHLDVALDNAHDATADAVAAAGVVARLAERCDMDADAIRALYADRRYPHEFVRAFQALGQMSLGQLHAAQIRWYAEQTESRGKHWRRQANEQRHIAEVAHEEGADETAAIAEQEAAELDARVDAMDPAWPIKPIREGATR